VQAAREANDEAVAALYTADIANNETKNYDDKLIEQADIVLELTRSVMDKCGQDLSAQHSLINQANNTCKNSREHYYQWVTLCNTPQPPQACLDEIQPRDAQDSWAAANRSLEEALDALPGLEFRRESAEADFHGAEADSQAMIRKKLADAKTCDADILNKIDVKNATARAFDAARRACPGYECKSPEVPPPPPLETGTEISVIGTDDGVAFWALHGTITATSGLRLTVDFGPAARPGNQQWNGTFVPGGIKWGAPVTPSGTQAAVSLDLCVSSPFISLMGAFVVNLASCRSSFPVESRCTAQFDVGATTRRGSPRLPHRGRALHGSLLRSSF
jgi:hypothetical protein